MSKRRRRRRFRNRRRYNGNTKSNKIDDSNDKADKSNEKPSEECLSLNLSLKTALESADISANVSEMKFNLNNLSSSKSNPSPAINNSEEQSRSKINNGHIPNGLENKPNLFNPFHASSPLHSGIKSCNGNIKKQINNKAYKDELNLKKLNSFNDITIYTSPSAQSSKTPSKFHYDLNSSMLSEKSFEGATRRFSIKRSNLSKTRIRIRSTSESFMHHISINIISKIKRFYSRYSSRWIQNIVSLCMWMGLILKKVELKTTTINETTITCNRDEQQFNGINILITKVDTLITNVAQQSEQFKENAKLLQNLADRFGSLEESMKLCQSELNEIKAKQLSCQNVWKSAAPGPPPPPPLPPPMPTITSPTLKTTKDNLSTKSNKSEKQDKSLTNDSYRRPVISEDAIRQVKLKKITEANLTTRKQTQPLISKEILSKIKLKPVSLLRKSSISEQDIIFKDGMSPMSSLNRILQVNPTLQLAKRLKRAKTSSYIDVSRNALQTDRERLVKSLSSPR